MSKNAPTIGKMPSKGRTSPFTRLVLIVSWALALALVFFAGYLGWKLLTESQQVQASQAQVAVAQAPEKQQEQIA